MLFLLCGCRYLVNILAYLIANGKQKPSENMNHRLSDGLVDKLTLTDYCFSESASPYNSAPRFLMTNSNLFSDGLLFRNFACPTLQQISAQTLQLIAIEPAAAGALQQNHQAGDFVAGVGTEP